MAPENAPLERPLTRRDALKLIGAASLLGVLPSACRSAPPPEQDPRRPNILYLHSHDTGRYVGPYGYDVPTPNLQRFAAQGVLFRQAFCASPTCSPSRAALFTGITPGCNGMWGLAHRGYALSDYNQTFVPLLKRAGYTTALAGVQHIAAGDPWTCARKIGYDTLLPLRSHYAHAVARAAVGYLERPPTKPFFLDVGFVETHTLDPTPDGSYFGYPSGDPERAERPGALRDTPQTRRDMADFAVSAGALDNAIGRVLDALERSGLAENTLVIITTDHGVPLPGFKANHTDGGLGVMLMMRGPKGFSGGKVIDALVSHLDLFPTLCDLLALPPPPGCKGRRSCRSCAATSASCTTPSTPSTKRTSSPSRRHRCAPHATATSAA